MNQPAAKARRILSCLLLLAAWPGQASAQAPDRRPAAAPPLAGRWERVYSEQAAGPGAPAAASFRAVYSAPLAARDAGDGHARPDRADASGLRWLWVGDDRGFLRVAVLDPNSNALLGPTQNPAASYVGVSRIEVDAAPAADPQSRRVNAIFFEHNTGYLLKGGAVYMSTNAGFSWREVARAPAPDGADSGLPTLHSLSVTPKRACAVGMYGRDVVKESLVLCADRDRRNGQEFAEWRRVAVPAQTQLLHVALREGGDGYIVGTLGTILKTTDGGQNWRQVVTEAEALFQSYFLDDKRGWAVGQFGTLLRTEDGGETWNTVKLDFAAQVTNTTLRGIRFARNNQDGWIVGDQGTIIHTPDGGKSWRLLPPPSKESINALYVDETFCWAVGGNGNIWRYRVAGGAAPVARRPSGRVGRS